MAIENKELACINKPGSVEYISKQEYIERVKEIAKCKNDIIYFIEHYFRITNLDKGLHIVKLYDVQKDFIQFMRDNNRVICCSGRQQGKSSCYCMYILWLCVFHPDKSVLILAQREATAVEILKKVKDGYLYLPKWLKPSCVEMNKKSISFGNRSTIHVFASSSDGARGTSASILILDEFGFVQDSVADKLFTSVYPVVSSAKEGKVIVVSTPNSQQGLFYELWTKANSKDANKNIDGWKPFQMWWWQVPGHDEKWKQAQIQAIGRERFEQEFNNSFLANSSIKKLIPDDIIEKYRIRLSENKTQNYNQGKDLPLTSMDGSKNYVFRMYHDFDPSRTYLATFDCAEGIQKDNSVLYIWDVTDLSKIKMCLKFSANDVSILEFAYLTKELLKLYNNPYLAGESNGISLGYIEQLRVTYGYENFVRMNKDGGCGIDSHVQKKTKACLWTRDMMTTMGFDFDIYDKDLIDEMSTFVKKDTAKIHEIFAAMGDNHDDHIMCLVWMCWILNPENIEHYFDVKDTFQSSLGVVYPKTLSPLFEYLPSEVEKIFNDPNVKAFQYYKMENNNSKLVNDGKTLTNEEKMKLLQKTQIKKVEPQREIITMGQIEEGYRKKEQASRLNSNNSSGGYFGSIGEVDFSGGEMNSEWSIGYSNNRGFDSIFTDEDDDQGWSGPLW